MLFAKYNYNDEVKVDEMGRAPSTNVAEEECLLNIAGKARREETSREIKVYE
jgi:hypothetical protein